MTPEQLTGESDETDELLRWSAALRRRVEEAIEASALAQARSIAIVQRLGRLERRLHHDLWDGPASPRRRTFAKSGAAAASRRRVHHAFPDEQHT
jgi:hypothetical protein